MLGTKSLQHQTQGYRKDAVPSTAPGGKKLKSSLLMGFQVWTQALGTHSQAMKLEETVNLRGGFLL